MSYIFYNDNKRIFINKFFQKNKMSDPLKEQIFCNDKNIDSEYTFEDIKNINKYSICIIFNSRKISYIENMINKYIKTSLSYTRTFLYNGKIYFEIVDKNNVIMCSKQLEEGKMYLVNGYNIEEIM